MNPYWGKALIGTSKLMMVGWLCRQYYYYYYSTSAKPIKVLSLMMMGLE
jgi:hypothetical protein